MSGPRRDRDSDLERVLLRSILEDGSADSVFGLVADLDARVFAGDARHRAVWQAARAAHAAGRRPDYAAVREHLQAAGEMERVGGLAWLAGGLVQGVPVTRDVAGVARRLRELATLRAYARKLTEVLAQIEAGESLETIEASAARAIADASAMLDREDADPSLLALEALAELRDEIEGSAVGIATGIGGLDARLRGGGFLRGQLVYIGARPSRGKTSLLVQIAEAAAGAGKRVLFFSLEMPGREIQKRRLLTAAGVRVGRLRCAMDREKTEALDALDRALTSVAISPLRLTSNATRTAARIRADCYRERAARGLDLVVVDYLGYIAAENPKASLYESTTATSRALHALAADLDVPVVVGVQLNRAPETHGKAARRPTLAHFRDSGAIEQDADVAILIHQEAAENAIQEGAAELILAKQRNGPTGVIRAHFDATRVCFTDQRGDWRAGD